MPRTLTADPPYYSPLPWRTIRRSNQCGVRRITVVAHDTKAIAVFDAPNSTNLTNTPLSAREMADADLIVTAVNAYDQQHAILREFIAIEEEWQTVRALDSAADLMERRVAAVTAARLLVAEGE